MLKSCSGFSLVEVISSFGLLLVLISLLVPMMMKIYEERTVIDYKKEALVLLHNEKESFLYDSGFISEKEIHATTRIYYLSNSEEGGLTQLCIQWELPWGRKGKICDYAKK